MVKEISKYRFDIYTCAHPTLLPGIDLAWMASDDEKVVAAVILDLIDGDYGYVIFGRDKKKCFRRIDLPYENGFFKDKKSAMEELKKKMKIYESDDNDIFPQGDEKGEPLELFDLLVDPDKVHHVFKYVLESEKHEATRRVIQELAYQFKSPDKQYAKEFQLQFDSRLWELFLYIVFRRSGFEISNKETYPDFMLKKAGIQFAVEAVTVNPSQKEGVDVSFPDGLSQNLQDGYLPIKFGSSLTSKLNKKYWEKDHIKGKPFVIACHDYHQPGSMMFSDRTLLEYLYGIRLSFDENGQIVANQIKEHVWNGKRIPSRFFYLPDAENISAVLLTNTATISKFNRMGKLGGFGGEGIKMYRQGWLRDPNPNATEGIPFCVDIDALEYFESWRESITMYHNPQARYPVNWELFPRMTHLVWSEKDQTYQGLYEDHHVLSSCTGIYLKKNC